MHSQQQPSPEQIREVVIAGHGNLDKVRDMLTESPSFLNVAYEWGPDDTETAIQGAAHVGSTPIIEYLLEQGSPLDLCTAATLGRTKDIEGCIPKKTEPAHIGKLAPISLTEWGDLGTKAVDNRLK